MATYYFRNVGVNWGDAANWSLTDGGGATGAVPTAADDAYFTSNSGNCTINASARVCKTLVFSGVGAGNYAGTLTMTNGITVSGNVTLSATMTIAGASGLTINAAASLTSNGKTFPNSLTFSASVTYTLIDNWTVNGSFTLNTAITCVINGLFTLNVGGNFNVNGNTSGTSTIALIGSGNWSGSYIFSNNLILNPTGTITITGEVLCYNNTLTRLTTNGGSVDTGTSSLRVSNATIDTNGSTLPSAPSSSSTGVNWYNVIYGSNTPITLNSPLCVRNLLTLSNTWNGSTIYVNGSINFAAGSSNQGTSNIILNGTGTWSGGSLIQNNFTINTTGTITVSGSVGIAGNFTYIAGNVITSGSTLTIYMGITLNSNGIIWNNIYLGATSSSPVTLTSDLTCIGNVSTNTFGNSITFNGNTFYIGGSFSYSNGSLFTGTTNIVLNGTGTWSQTTTNALRNNLTINTSGTITISGNVYYNTGTLTYTAGTVTTTGSTINVSAATTINVNNSGLSLNNITALANVTFGGTNGCSIAKYTCSTAGTTHTFASTRTYTITTLSIAGTSASKATLKSSVAGSKAILNFTNISSNYNLNVTDINSSGGSAGYTFGGTVTNSDNWNASTNLFYVGTGAFLSTTSWSPYSGGVPITSITGPAAGDSIRFDANSVNNCTVSAQTIVIFNVNFTGYSQTITVNGALYFNGSLTLSPTMTIAGTSRFHWYGGSGTLTSNGKIFEGNLTTENPTITLADDFTITGQFNLAAGVIGNFNINCYNGVALNLTGAGNPVLNLYGGTMTGSVGAGGAGLAINIQGDCTIGTLTIRQCTLTYINGIVTTTGTLTIASSNLVNTRDIIWNNVTFSTGFANGILSDMNVSGTLTLAGLSLNGAGFRINAMGNVLQNDSSIVVGTATLVFTGTGTWTNTSTGVLRLNTIINTQGTLTISGTVRYNTGTLTYTSGRVVCLAGSTLNIDTGTYINLDKINWRTVNVNPASTITMNRFFSGSASIPTRIQSSTPGSNYTIAFQDGFEKITKFTKISNCTISRRGQLLCITDKSNKGGNVGVRYINQLPNGVPKNAPTVAAAMAYSVANISDPNFIIG